MAMLLRKVWGSVLARAAAAAPGSPRGRAEQYYCGGALSLGALDALPTDVLAQILRLLGPVDAARSATVCRAWRILASDNGLWAFFLRLGPEPWDLVVFAETHLAAGPDWHPWLYYNNLPQLSFKQIYTDRAMVPGTVIVDGGSGYCKYGWSKYAAPSGRCATFLKLCYVAADYEAELRKDTQASCEVDGEGWFTLSEERFKTAEVLFQPHMGGMRAMGLHKAVSLCMDHCYNSDVVGDDSWYKTVVLAGGSSCLPGLPERLEKELRQLLPPYISEGIRVLPPSFGTDSAWFGAKMVSTFTEAWCVKKKQFRHKTRRNGPLFVNAW
nr:unnamed protein product [Digitaria exilis]